MVSSAKVINKYNIYKCSRLVLLFYCRKSFVKYTFSTAYDLIHTSLHLLYTRIFVLDKELFREGMKMNDIHTAGYVDFLRLVGVLEFLKK